MDDFLLDFRTNRNQSKEKNKPNMLSNSHRAKSPSLKDNEDKVVLNRRSASFAPLRNSSSSINSHQDDPELVVELIDNDE